MLTFNRLMPHIIDMSASNSEEQVNPIATLLVVILFFIAGPLFFYMTAVDYRANPGWIPVKAVVTSNRIVENRIIGEIEVEYILIAELSYTVGTTTVSLEHYASRSTRRSYVEEEASDSYPVGKEIPIVVNPLNLRKFVQKDPMGFILLFGLSIYYCVTGYVLARNLYFSWQQQKIPVPSPPKIRTKNFT